MFYEGAGSDEFTSGDEKLVGAYVDDEWGQTGANSSMYKWFDLLCGVSAARQATTCDPIMMSKVRFDCKMMKCGHLK